MQSPDLKSDPMSNQPLDLSRLAIDRAPPAASASQPRRRRVLTRYVVPAAILLGFCGLLGAAAGTQWLPRTAVTVLPVLVSRADVQPEGTPLFQAAGWIEPRPTPISVAALAPGVIEELLVVEGQQVKKDQPIARLIAVDAELAVRQTQANLAIRQGQLERAQAELRAAQIRVDNPVHLQVLLADAHSMLAQAKTELAKLPYLIEAATARKEYADSNLQGKRAAKAGVAGRLLQQAESEYAEAQATLQELQHRGPYLQREVDALQDKANRLQTQLELLVEETRQLQEAEANVQSAAAVRDEAELQVEQAQLTLQRMLVRAPLSGRILKLTAAPGTRLMGWSGSTSHSSSTVVQMYDPQKLQVRADVRLEDVPLVQQGQPVEIETASSSTTIRGRVLQMTSSANIQKNTLEVKVELIDPPLNVSPEMLVTATFLAPVPVNRSSDEPSQVERILVPRQLVQTSEAGAFVWIVDAAGLAQRPSVTLGKATKGELIEIREGLNATDKLIASETASLEPAARVEVTGEDHTIGAGR